MARRQRAAGADPLDRLEIYLRALVVVARIVRPAGEVHADRLTAQPAQVVDPRAAEAAGVVDEGGVGVPVAPLARDGARALGAVDVAELHGLEGDQALARE